MREIEGTGEIRAVKYAKENLPSEKQILETAKVYIEVFGGHPWYECNKCDVCKTFFGPETIVGSKCMKCEGGNLDLAYPIDETVQNISTILTESFEPRMYLLENDSSIKGFVWGRPRDFLGYSEKFGEYAGMEMDLLKKITNNDTLFSISEIGVEKSLRGRGFGKLLIEEILMDARELGLSAGVWTRCDTILTPICLKKGFVQTYGPETIIKNGRVELSGKTIIGVSNSTPERVFFIKQ